MAPYLAGWADMATTADLRKKAKELKKTLAKIEKLTGADKSKDAERMAKSRATARDLEIGEPEDPERRRQLGEDDAAWLKEYMPDVFYSPFTDDQLEAIAECRESLRYGTKKCRAAPRGDGKSSIVKYLALKYALYRQVRFPLVIASTYGKAQKTTKSLRKRLASKNDTMLRRDFPLECKVAEYVDPWPSRARNVTGDGGRPIHVEWGAAEGYFILPSWVDEEPVGPIVMSIGYSSDELQGCNIYDLRPDFVMLDDLDSRDSLASEHGVIAEKIEEAVEKTIAGLGGPSRRLGQYMICTITSTDAAAYKYSDPKMKPAWSGSRVGAIREWPTATVMWEKYIWLRQSGMQGDPPDRFGRKAHQFYLEHRDEMDAGAVLSNPYNFDGEELPDGTQKQASSLQRCYDYIADHGRESFDTEHQNDPPKRQEILETRVSTYQVATCAGEYDRRLVDPTTTMICRGIDVRKIELHQVSMAQDEVFKHRIIDYDVRSHGTTETTVEQAEELILEALRKMVADWEESPCLDVNGMPHGTDLALIDKGWVGNWTEDGVVKTWASQPVETFCMESGLRRWLPAKAAPNYQSPKPSDDCIVGDNWHMNRGEGKARRCTEVIWNASHWHLLVEELFMLERGDPDRFELFTPADGIYTNHKGFGEHITAGATQLKDELLRGSRSRKPRFVRDHWWDSAAMMLVGQSVEAWFRQHLKPKTKSSTRRDVRRDTKSEIGAR